MNIIPTNLLKAAQEIARSQGTLAASPAQQTTSGDVVMCAASCVAYADIWQREGIGSATIFRKSLISPKGFEILYQAFERLGSSRILCKKMHMENDERLESERLSWFDNLKAFAG
jgi:hypothetical protein